MMQRANQLLARNLLRVARPSPTMFRMVTATPVRMFGHTKYQFDDEDWNPSITQLSMETHATNAEELINEMPIVEVHGSVTRCTGV